MATGNEPVHPAANIFPMIDGKAFDELVEDIRQHGQREPVVYWKQQLLDGRNRLKACQSLNIEPQTCELDDDVDPLAYVLSANLHRRHLNESQRGMVGGRIEKYLAVDNKERQKVGQKSGGRGRKKNLVANLPPSLEVNGERIPNAELWAADQRRKESRKSRDLAAEAVNVSGRTVSDGKAVLEKGSPELIAAVDAGEVAVSKAAKVARGVPKKEQLAAAVRPSERREKTPFEHLCHWWEKADSAARTRFRLWIDGECT